MNVGQNRPNPTYCRAMERTHLSAAEVAQRIGKSPGTVKRLTREGRLPAAFKLPGHSGAYVYAVETVDEYLAGAA